MQKELIYLHSMTSKEFLSTNLDRFTERDNLIIRTLKAHSRGLELDNRDLREEVKELEQEITNMDIKLADLEAELEQAN